MAFYDIGFRHTRGGDNGSPCAISNDCTCEMTKRIGPNRPIPGEVADEAACKTLCLATNTPEKCQYVYDGSPALACCRAVLACDFSPKWIAWDRTAAAASHHISPRYVHVGNQSATPTFCLLFSDCTNTEKASSSGVASLVGGSMFERKTTFSAYDVTLSGTNCAKTVPSAKYAGVQALTYGWVQRPANADSRRCVPAPEPFNHSIKA